MNKGLRFDKEYDTMPWHKVDSVVFDIGNVLIYYAPKDFLERLFPGDEALQAHMLRTVYQGPYWPNFDRGTMSYEEASQRLAAEFGLTPELYMHALTGWIDLKRPIEEGWRAANRCRRAGKRLYLLSNYPVLGYEVLRERHADLFSIFDGGVISSHVHQVKPEKEIYDTLIAECELDPARTLFIDDSLANIEAANNVGIHGFHMREAGMMDKFFI